MENAMNDPFARIDDIPTSEVDYWVDQLNDSNFDADAVAQVFFASKAESEVSTTLGKITTLKDNIEKILRSKVTSNYMTFIKARDTIKKTGLEMSKLRELVDHTSHLIQDVRNNRLETSKTMRKSSIIGMVTTLAHSPKLGQDFQERIKDEQGIRGRSDSFNSSESSSYSDVESLDGDDLTKSLQVVHGMNQEDQPSESSLSRKTKTDHDRAVAQMLEQYTNGTTNPNEVPDWFTRSPAELTNLIIEKSYSSAVKLVCRVRDYSEAWRVQYQREKDAYREAKSKGLDEHALGLQGLSRDERKAAVNKQNRVVDIAERVEAKQLHFAHTLKDSIIALPHSHVWGVGEQRKRLKLLITLGHYALAAEAFSKSRVDIIQTVLRDVEASGDPKIYIADLSKGFYTGLLDVAMTFLQLFSRHAHIPSIMNILVMWCHSQTSALVDILMQHVQESAKECAALAIVHLKPTVPPVQPSVVNGGSTSPVLSSISPMRGGRERSDSNNSAISAITAMSAKPLSPRGITSNFRLVEGPLKFTRDCLNIAFRESVELNQTGLQGFADLSWLVLPQLKKLVNTYSEDLIKETINQVRLDSWAGVKPRVTSVDLPRSLVNQSIDDDIPFHLASKVEDGDQGDWFLGASFDWLVVCLNHYIDDAWHLLRLPRKYFNADKSTESKSLVGDFNRENDSGATTSDNADNGEDDLDDDPVEIDADTGQPRYKLPAYRRMNFCEIEPIIVINILRIISHYAIELECIDASNRRCADDKPRKQILIDTCRCFREVMLPSVHKFIENIFFNLHMCNANGAEVSMTPSPNAVLAECAKKVSGIERKLLMLEE